MCVANPDPLMNSENETSRIVRLGMCAAPIGKTNTTMPSRFVRVANPGPLMKSKNKTTRLVRMGMCAASTGETNTTMPEDVSLTTTCELEPPAAVGTHINGSQPLPTRKCSPTSHRLRSSSSKATSTYTPTVLHLLCRCVWSPALMGRSFSNGPTANL